MRPGVHTAASQPALSPLTCSYLDRPPKAAETRNSEGWEVGGWEVSSQRAEVEFFGHTCNGGEPSDLLVLGQAPKGGRDAELWEVGSVQSANEARIC